MIISNDGKSWVMALPSRCGSTSMYYLVRKTNFAREVGPWHGGFRMDSKEQAIVNPCRCRILLVRDPLKRYVSLFWFLINDHYKEFTEKVKGLSWYTGAKYDDVRKCFSEFLEWLVWSDATTSRVLWPLMGYMKMFQPDELVRVESVGEWLRGERVKSPRAASAYCGVGRHCGRGRAVVETVGQLSGLALAFLRAEYSAIDQYELPPCVT